MSSTDRFVEKNVRNVKILQNTYENHEINVLIIRRLLKETFKKGTWFSRPIFKDHSR